MGETYLLQCLLLSHQPFLPIPYCDLTKKAMMPKLQLDNCYIIAPGNADTQSLSKCLKIGMLSFVGYTPTGGTPNSFQEEWTESPKRKWKFMMTSEKMEIFCFVISTNRSQQV